MARDGAEAPGDAKAGFTYALQKRDLRSSEGQLSDSTLRTMRTNESKKNGAHAEYMTDTGRTMVADSPSGR